MNCKKAQKEIFNKLVNGERVCFFRLGEEKIFVTPDGFKGFIFALSDITFNVDKLQEFKALQIDEVVVPENEIVQTNDFRLYPSFLGRKKMCRKFNASGKTVYVDESYLDFYQNPKFFQDKANRNKHIVIVEKDCMNRLIPVGVALPVRTSEADD